ncbi:hypothetical protein ACFQJC_13950 [Haloferax namakaokahaiae]|uniref:Uncharacterized protein n=1 Tax=Haloferax namakaokahaiae TaxID=1748331 RepID=A0ABD5ZHP2_9EURY
MSRLTYLLPSDDDTLGRFLALTLLIFTILSGFQVGVLLGSMLLAGAIWVLVTAIQGLRYGYLEGVSGSD